MGWRMKFVILHISDLHIKQRTDSVLSRAEEIAKCAYEYLRGVNNVFIVVSGDISFSGTKEQFDLAKDFFSDLKIKILEEHDCNVDYIVAPGNHDSNFCDNDETRNIIVKSITDRDKVDVNVVENCTKIQNNFFKFRDDIEELSIDNEDLLWRSRQFIVNSKTVCFEILNVAWLSQKEEVQGKLYFPVQNYENKIVKSCDLRIVVMHHPINWYREGIYREFRTFLRQISDIIITGHEHKGTAGIIDDAEAGMSVYIEGSALHGENNESGFIITAIDLDNKKFNATQYKWKKSSYEMVEHGSWFAYHSLPKKHANPFTILDSFVERLEDPGAFIAVQNAKKVSLSDIYVYPDLRIISENFKTRPEYINSSILLNPERTASGVLIQGEEKSGATSLLYQMYLKYHENNFVPVYINGTDIKKSDKLHIERVINNAIIKQYGEDSLAQYKKYPKKLKMILVDSLDQSQISSMRVRLELVAQLKDFCSNIVLTVGEMFELKEMLEYEAEVEASYLDHYVIQQINYSLRAKIINKWFKCVSDETCDESKFIALCDNAEKQIETIMGKTLIPSAPLYLITLLQSITLHNGNDFKETALGHYYHYLITGAFSKFGVQPNELTELFQYSSHLAWEFHSSNSEVLTKSELERFNLKFSTQWTKVNFNTRLKLLLDARILTEDGESYSFRYPYIYYYLKSLYISKNLLDVSIREYVVHCTQHLYVRDYANTVLFLAHHSNDNFLLDAIISAYKSLFDHCSPVRFVDDTGMISSLIEVVQKLVYTGESPAEYRQRTNELKDVVCTKNDGLSESEETTPQLSLFAQLMMLFKTTEILGQILKNQYSTIRKAEKISLITDIFNGPLRALGDFYSYIQSKPDAFFAEIESLFVRKGSQRSVDEINAIVRHIVSKIVQGVSYVFLYKGAHAVNSNHLTEEIDQSVISNDTIGFKIIQLLTYLDSPKPIPRRLLGTLIPLIEHDFLTYNIVKLAVLQHLYMFKTTEKDMQWLSTNLNLSMHKQHAITYHSTQRRLLK